MRRLTALYPLLPVTYLRSLHSRFGNETLGDEVKVGLTYTKENGSREDTSMAPSKFLVSICPTTYNLATFEFKI